MYICEGLQGARGQNKCAPLWAGERKRGGSGSYGAQSQRPNQAVSQSSGEYTGVLLQTIPSTVR